MQEQLEQIQADELLTPEKANYIETQAEKMLGFFLDSYDVLTKKAHTTLNWLISIIVGSGAFLTSLLDSSAPRWWLIAAIGAAMFVATCVAISLFVFALQTIDIHGPGNSPANLLTHDFLQHELPWMKVAQLQNVENRIHKLGEQCEVISTAINRARLWLVCIPPVAIASAIAAYWISG